MVSVVGILGFKGSGKDTAGDFLVSQHGYCRDSFANPLKDAVSATFGWPRHLLEGDTTESRLWRETPDTWWEERLDWANHPGSKISDRFTPRVALQWFGTEVFRTSFHDKVWIYSLENRIRNKDKVVITDCRFPNEVNVVRETGGLVWRIKRGPEPEWFNAAIEALEGNEEAEQYMINKGIHISEWAWLTQKFDAVIENEGSISDLEAHVLCLLQNRS